VGLTVGRCKGWRGNVEVEVVHKSTCMMIASTLVPNYTRCIKLLRDRETAEGMRRSILLKAHYVPVLLLLLYPAILFHLTIPWLQKQYASSRLYNYNWLQIDLPPLGTMASMGRIWYSREIWACSYVPHHRISLMIAFKTRNFRVNTSDGENLGVWHVLYVISIILW